MSFTTTTLFADPTALGLAPVQSAKLPVVAIAAGTSAGVVLAVLAVFVWKCWGRRIKIQQHQQRQKRKARQAAIAYRRSVLNGTKKADPISDPQRSLSASSDRKVKFAGTPVTTTNTTTTPTPASISSPRPLKPRATEPVPARPPFLNSYKPFRPSPLATTPSPRTPFPDPHLFPLPHPAVDNTSAPPPARALNEKPDTTRAPSSFARIPRIKASLSSLTGEARRQSRVSQNSTSDQSRHSSAGGSARRWSWWSLINGTGFSLRQIGAGTGNNRLSADTSLFTEWQEEDPSLPIGYAYSGIDQDPSDTITETKDYVILDSRRNRQDTESALVGDERH